MLTIRYTSLGQEVSFVIYDRVGQEVRTLEGNGSQAIWDGRNSQGTLVASGTYIVMLRASGTVLEKMVVVVK